MSVGRDKPLKLRPLVSRGKRQVEAGTEVSIPVADLEGCRDAFPASFARTRSLDGVKGSGLYVWGPDTLCSFGDGENFGTIDYTEK